MFEGMRGNLGNAYGMFSFVSFGSRMIGMYKQAIDARETNPAAVVLVQCFQTYYLFQLSKFEEGLEVVNDVVDCVVRKPYVICKAKVYVLLRDMIASVCSFVYLYHQVACASLDKFGVIKSRIHGSGQSVA